MSSTLQKLPKRLQSTTLARFQDCDPFGHLNNSRYIDYLLDARQDQILEHYGLEFLSPERRTSWVVSQFQIAYFRPVLALERVLIRTRLIGFDDKTLTVEGAFLSESDKRLKALAWVHFTHVRTDAGGSTDHPEEMLSLFGRIRADNVDPTAGFEARSMDLRGIMRDLAV